MEINTKIEQRIMKFLVKMEKMNVEIRDLLLSVYGNAAISRAMFFK